MTQLKKMLLAVAVLVTPILLATSVMAQGVAFSVSPLSRQVRIEGRTETVGEIVLQAPVDAPSGPGPGTVVAGSTIAVVYQATITGVPGTAGTPTAVSCLVPPAVVFAVAACPAGMTVGAVSLGSTTQLTISFSAPIVFGNAAGEVSAIDISQIRADISALGSGTTTVSATMSGVSAAPSTNPLTFSPPQVQIATVQSPSTKVTYANTGSLAAPGIVLTCNAVQSTATTVGGATFGNLGVEQSFTIKTAENFTAALTAAADEAGFTPGYTTAPTGVVLSVVFHNVPNGYTIAPTAVGFAQTGLLTVVNNAPASATQSGTGDLTFTYTVIGTGGAGTPTGTNVADSITLGFFAVALKGATSSVGGAPVVVTADVKLGAIDTSTTPAVISFANNIQGTVTAFTVNDCRTYLVFPWASTDTKGGVDTGFAIANTSSDPTVLGTRNQTGTVTLYFFPNKGATAPAPVVLNSGTALAAGDTATYVLSSLGAPFSGYIIAVCNFQMGHGFAFISNPAAGATGWAEGYLALSVTNPRLPLGFVTESSGH